MSTKPPSPFAEDPLARAEAAFRRMIVPDGPSEETADRTIAALRAQTHSNGTLFPRRKTMFTAMKIAAAVLVSAGGLLYFAFAPTTKATAAFAEVAEKLRKAHTLSYRTTTESPDLKEPMKMRCFFKEPKLMRAENDNGLVVIGDGSQGKQLMLDAAGKAALLLEGKAAEAPPGPAAATGFIESLRQLTEGDAKPLPDKVIGDVRARGYHVKKLGIEMTVWVDPATRLPLRIESSDRVQGKEIRTALTDFQIDPELDDSLFRLEIPQGYALRKEESKTIGMDEKTLLNPEKAASDWLRIFAEKTGGTFPKSLDDLSELDKVFPKKTKVGALPDGETLRVIQSVSRFMVATRSLKEKFGYRSDGVKLGDADKILFWYRPDGAAGYRVLYGDLHAGDVAEDKLPEKPKP